MQKIIVTISFELEELKENDVTIIENALLNLIKGNYTTEILDNT